MQPFTILAWLPGMPSFVAKQGEQYGLLTLDKWEPHRGDYIMASACSKYGFIPVEPVQATQDQLQDVEKQFEAKYGPVEQYYQNEEE